MNNNEEKEQSGSVNSGERDFESRFFSSGADPLDPMDRPEIVFGIVGPVGVDRKSVCDVLGECLEQYGYEVHRISVSKLITLVPGNEALEGSYNDEYERIENFMTAGTQTREDSGLADAMALLAICEINDIRIKLALERKLADSEADASVTGIQAQAYILDSLKHPAEINTLRATYGMAFSVISAHADREMRVKSLAKRIAESRYSHDIDECRTEAESLINRDEKEEGTKLGQDVQNAFPMADLFIDLENSSRKFADEISRFCEIVFNNPFHTPTKDEFGMFQAESASWRSADLSRQVGAAICDDDGSVLALGCNEVPKAGGGLYWEDTVGDSRDFKTGVEQGTKQKRFMLAEVIEKLKNQPDLVDPGKHGKWDELKEKALKGEESEVLDDLQALNIIEYGRAVHAEMAALSDAARRGVGVNDTTMYVNTFPCHICARHIIAAGIRRVVFVQPYPKSHTTSLFNDSITTSGEGCKEKVMFRPFSGIAPRFYRFAFEQNGQRKQDDGSVVKWAKGYNATTKLKRFVFSYLIIENEIVKEMVPRIKKLD